MNRLHKLIPELKLQVIERLAAFASRYAIAGSLKRDHGIDITPQPIAFHDPTPARQERPHGFIDFDEGTINSGLAPSPSAVRQVLAGCDGDAEAAVGWLIVAINRLARDLEYALQAARNKSSTSSHVLNAAALGNSER